MVNNGTAYGFFDCGSSRENIEAELPTIREFAQIPSALEVNLMEGFDSLEEDSGLLEIAREARQAGIRYVMKATYPNASNKAAAAELSGILNQAYQSPLYKDNEPFTGQIVYKDSGAYTFWE